MQELNYLVPYPYQNYLRYMTANFDIFCYWYLSVEQEVDHFLTARTVCTTFACYFRYLHFIIFYDVNHKQKQRRTIPNTYGSNNMSPLNAKPTNQEIVLALMKNKGITKETISSKTLARGTLVNHHNFECPNPDCEIKIIKFQTKKGYSNPFRHLKSCVASGNEALLEAKYTAIITGESVLSHYAQVRDNLCPDVATMHSWILMLVEKGAPLNSVQDQIYRDFSKCVCTECTHRKKHFSTEKVKEVMNKIVIEVEEKITEEMKSAGRGALMYDGWSKASTHYVGLMATYLREIVVWESTGVGSANKKKVLKKELAIVLLSVAPMAAINENDNPDHDEDDDNISEEATNFCAETHAEHFKTILLNYYGQTLVEWAVCFIADNAPVNPRMARLLKLPHIGCKNHKLALEVNLMLRESMTDLNAAILLIAELMKRLKGSIRNAAALRMLTALKPILFNKTRWSGKLYVIARFLRLRPLLIDLSTGEEGERLASFFAYPILTEQFRLKVDRWRMMLEDIDCVTKMLQTKGISLSYSQELLSDLRGDIVEATLPQHRLHGCGLGGVYIAENSEKLVSRHFHSGVIKIQTNMTATMTVAEKTACATLKVMDTNARNEMLSNDSANLSFVERQAKKQRLRLRLVDDSWANCDFILGSAAEVERLWSLAENILTDGRMSITPLMLETILFLKVNRRFWDATSVSRAMNDVVNAHAVRLESLAVEEELLEDLMQRCNF